MNLTQWQMVGKHKVGLAPQHLSQTHTRSFFTSDTQYHYQYFFRLGFGDCDLECFRD